MVTTQSKILVKIKRFLKILGPGLITGASDDDPSGIVTYSQAGTRFGFNTLWTAFLTFPLMAGIQEMCARIGLVTSVGLTTTLKKHYSPILLYAVMLLSIPAVILNIGADIAGMGAVANLLFPSINGTLLSLLFTIILTFSIIFLPYQKIVSLLKYLCISLLFYIAVPFFTHPDWRNVFESTFLPSLHLNRDFFEIIVAILGTTISPYLFFWQVTMEAEDVKGVKQLIVAGKSLSSDKNYSKREKNLFRLLINKLRTDVNIGMLLSNLVMFFIILATGSALYGNGNSFIDTVEQAAKALEPVAGRFSYLLFAIGVISTGFLAIPILCGSLSYIVAETFGWNASLDSKYKQAKPFYLVIIISLFIGFAIQLLGITPVKALYYTAILYGITSPLLIALVLHIGNRKSIMGEYINGRLSNTLGFVTLILMTGAAIGLIWFILT